MADTTKSNSYITVEVVMIALTFVYYLAIYIFFTARAEDDKRKKNSIKHKYKQVHVKFLSLHPVSY